MTGIYESLMPKFFKPRETKLATRSVQRHKEIYDAEALKKRVEKTSMSQSSQYLNNAALTVSQILMSYIIKKTKVLVSSQFRYRNIIFQTLAIAYIGNKPICTK